MAVPRDRYRRYEEGLRRASMTDRGRRIQEASRRYGGRTRRLPEGLFLRGGGIQQDFERSPRYSPRRGGDSYQWWNPFDWFGQHDETSWWKSDEENRRIMRERDRAARGEYIPRRGDYDYDRPTGVSDRGWNQRKELRRRQREFREAEAARKAERDAERELARKAATRPGESQERIQERMDEYLRLIQQQRSQMDSMRQARLGRWGDYQQRFEEGMSERDRNRLQMQREFAQRRDADWADWQASRDKTLGQFLEDRGATEEAFAGRQRDVLARWGPVVGMEMEQLNRNRNLQYSLIDEIRRSPSTVAQQARQAQDRQIQQAVSMAAMGGRGVSGPGQALRNQVTSMDANLLGQTAAARSAEHMSRLGMQSDIMGRAAGISNQIVGLGQSDAELRRAMGLDEFNVRNRLATQETALRNRLGEFGFGAGRQLSADTMGMWNAVQGQLRENMADRRANFSDRLALDQMDLQEMGINRQGMMNAFQMGMAEDDALRAWGGLRAGTEFNYSGLNQSAFQYGQSLLENMFQHSNLMNERQRQFNENFAENQRQFNQRFAENQYQWDDRMGEGRYRFDLGRQDAELARMSSSARSIGSGILGLGGSILGGIFGGPMGAAAGGSIGSSMGSLFGGATQPLPGGSPFSGANMNPYLPTQMLGGGMPGNFGGGFQSFGGRGIPGAAQGIGATAMGGF